MSDAVHTGQEPAPRSPAPVAIAVTVLNGSPTLTALGRTLWTGSPDKSPAAYLRALGLTAVCPTGLRLTDLVEYVRRDRTAIAGPRPDPDAKPDLAAWRRDLRREWKKLPRDGWPSDTDDAYWHWAVSEMLPDGKDTQGILRIGPLLRTSAGQLGEHRETLVTLDIATVRNDAFDALDLSDDGVRRIDRALAAIFGSLGIDVVRVGGGVVRVVRVGVGG